MILLLLAAVLNNDYPLDKEMASYLKGGGVEIKIIHKVTKSSDGYNLKYRIENIGKSDLLFSYELLNNLVADEVLVKLPAGQVKEYIFKSPSMPVIKSGKLRLWNYAGDDEYKFAVETSDEGPGIIMEKVK